LKLYHTAQIKLTERLKDEYLSLPVKPDECIECGECMRRCPFGVDVLAKMRAMTKIFS
jgi:NAD-dependent dihydropyrimidine dehydrogenase PreA subunit